MENASKALIMGAAVLLGIMLLSLMMYVFNKGGEFFTEQDKAKQVQQLQKFNAKWEAYNNNQKLYASDIATLINMAREHNANPDNAGSEIAIGIHNSIVSTIVGSPRTAQSFVAVSGGTAEEFIKHFKGEEFECSTITYYPDGKVQSVGIEKYTP